jgi:hypothetical protein
MVGLLGAHVAHTGPKSVDLALGSPCHWRALIMLSAAFCGCFVSGWYCAAPHATHAPFLFRASMVILLPAAGLLGTF